jgi:predicted acyltransferase
MATDTSFTSTDPTSELNGSSASCELPATTSDGAVPSKLSQRLVSLDALRGFDMFWIIGGDAFIRALMKWGDWSFSPAVIEQFEHVEWEGFRFYDMIFPLFVFLAGVSMPYSLGRQREKGVPLSSLFWRVFRRMVLLFVLGLLCNNILQFDPPFRIMGVLQRIALATGFAGFIYLLTRTRGLVAVLVGILLGYWALLAFVPPPGGEPNYTKGGNLSAYIDRTVIRDGMNINGKAYGRVYYGSGDTAGENEGLLSTIPAIATALLGVLVGVWLRFCSCNWRKVGWLFVAGFACLGLGVLWGQVFPIIKILWTSSYVLVAGGYSILLLALFYLIIDVWGFKRWAFPFVVIGVNSITIYVVPRFLAFRQIVTFFFGGLIKHSAPFDAVLTPMLFLFVEWLFLYYLYRKQIFLRV